MDFQGNQTDNTVAGILFSYIRYTSLVRRNFLRFGKRSGGPNSSVGMNLMNEDFDDDSVEMVSDL